jgi:hypothetical protein
MLFVRWFHQHQDQLRAQHERVVAVQTSVDVVAEDAAAVRVARSLAETVTSYVPAGAQNLRTYRSAADMATGITFMRPQGWQAIGIREQHPRSGRLRAVALDAVETPAFAPHARAIVTYTRMGWIVAWRGAEHAR